MAGGLLWLVRMQPDVTSAGPIPFLVFLGNLVLLLGVLVPCLFQGLFFHTPFRTFLPLVKDTPVLSFFLDNEPPP